MYTLKNYSMSSDNNNNNNNKQTNGLAKYRASWFWTKASFTEKEGFFLMPMESCSLIAELNAIGELLLT